jgi:hypothetical protein
MDTSTCWLRLSQILSDTKCNSFYVIPSFDLNKCFVTLPCSVICLYTAPNSSIGHYFALYYYVHQGQIVCDGFDSFGHLPSHYDASIDVGYPINYYNKWQIQPSDSLTCYMYCLYFLHQRASGFTYRKLMKKFGSDTLENDSFVKNYYDMKITKREVKQACVTKYYSFD